MSKELGAISKNVHTSRFRYIDRVQTNRKNLLQVSSEIVGELSGDYSRHMGDILCSLLPAGSIAGSPKQKALDILREVEGRNRNYYCQSLQLRSCSAYIFFEDQKIDYIQFQTLEGNSTH